MSEPAEELVARLGAGMVGVLTTRGTGERLLGRPIEFVSTPFTGSLWFICPDKARLIAQIQLTSEVQVTFSGDDGWTVLGAKAHTANGAMLPAEVRRCLDAAGEGRTAVQVVVLTARHWAAGVWVPDTELSSSDVVPD
ncbi:pyridoxamine 5'-phosphate oxidase family protein [Solicola sp. PLA-1-18]|uniref:pyridoxamine 5'-phosphate oxidase family protein n=1 Tax=Solicola sp. PLA-1-18 TaxID=3380532 RepID=UPI003B7F9EBC